MMYFLLFEVVIKLYLLTMMEVSGPRFDEGSLTS